MCGTIEAAGLHGPGSKAARKDGSGRKPYKAPPHVPLMCRPLEQCLDEKRMKHGVTASMLQSGQEEDEEMAS